MDEIIKHFGGRAKLAYALGVTPSAVTVWCRMGTLPANRAIQIERLSAGRFRAVDIPTEWTVTDQERGE